MLEFFKVSMMEKELRSELRRVEARLGIFYSVYEDKDLSAARSFYLTNAEEICRGQDFIYSVRKAHEAGLEAPSRKEVLRMEALRRFRLDLMVAKRYCEEDPKIEGPIKNLFDLIAHEQGEELRLKHQLKNRLKSF